MPAEGVTENIAAQRNAFRWLSCVCVFFFLHLCLLYMNLATEQR